jgi:hypothetical protein
MFIERKGQPEHGRLHVDRTTLGEIAGEGQGDCRRFLTVMTAMIVAAGALVHTAAAQPLDMVLSRAAAYVAAYERDLGNVIAEEYYTQVVSHPAAADPIQRLGNPVLHRTLRSEFLLLRASGRTERWVGFRDVLYVDGRSVLDRRRPHERLLRGPDVGEEEVRRLVNDSARYNIGGVTRTVNVPTFALLILHAEIQGRFSFEKRNETRVAGTRAWALTYEERARPTIIRNTDGTDMPAVGTLWVEPESGRVVKTEVITEEPSASLQAGITVGYRRNDKLKIWVPSEMTERYHIGRRNSSSEHNIQCVAIYSNFRRFEVAVKLRVPE